MAVVDRVTGGAVAPDPLAGVSVEKLELVSERKGYPTLRLDVAKSLIAGEIEDTIEGASTVRLTIADPEWVVLRSGLLTRGEREDVEGPGTDDELEPVDIKLDDHWYRLMQVSAEDDDLSLTFEDRPVTYLRQHKRFVKANRGSTTRAEFARRLVKEVKADGGIRFYSPELHKRQPIAKTPKPRTTRERETNREPGLAKHAKLTVKGATATSEQKRNMDRVLDVAHDLKAGAKATKALVEACIVESRFLNVPGGDRDSVGILQLRALHLGGSKSTKGGRRDIELVVKLFLTKGFWGKGGAIALAKKNSGKSAGWIAQQVQGSAFPGRYDQVAAEADKIIKAFAGGAGGTRGSRTTSEEKPFEFSRGQPRKREDSWTCLQRLAEEVRWRCFMRNGVVYFMAEEDLFKSKPRYLLKRGNPELLGISFDWDKGKLVNEMTVQVMADRWTTPPGTIVDVANAGPANGRWLIATVRRPLHSNVADITLKQPQPSAKEPAPEVIERASGGDSGDGGGNSSGKTGRVTGDTGGLSSDMKTFLALVAGQTDESINITSGRRNDPGSNHHRGAGADIGVGGDARSSSAAARKGDNICTAVLMVCGMSRTVARRSIGTGRTNFSVNSKWRGHSVEVGWRTLEGGNHFNHVHVGFD